MTPIVRAQYVKTAAKRVGFDLVGITSAAPLARGPYYRQWLSAGHAGEMAYMHRNVPLREKPTNLLPGARSVICVGLSYHRRPESDSGRPGPAGRFAAYARGRDYHVVLRRMLHDLETRLRADLDEDFAARACVDTAPVLERELAERAGLGWIGKNTCLLNREFGSDVFLGELFTTLELVTDTPATDHCARCTRCLEACPTAALHAPREMNAARCISYLTIEHRAPISEPFHQAMDTWVYGCDICQEVCPYNRKAPAASNPDLTANELPSHLNLLDLLRLGSGDYRRLTRQSAARRARRNMWRRNAAIALGNAATYDAGEQQAATRALDEASRDDDESVRRAACAALRRRQHGQPPA